MLKKRLIGVVTVKNGWAVQSFGYQRYLPLGKVECLVENLDRWGVDEIFVQVLDRSNVDAGPDFTLLRRLGALGVTTPLTYGGGIRSVADALAVVNAGADRVVVDQLAHTQPAMIEQIAYSLGAQAVIVSMPLSSPTEWYDYRTRTTKPTQAILPLLKTGAISEIIVIDWKNEGTPAGFRSALINDLSLPGISLIPFGGLSEVETLRSLLQRPNIPAVAIGNFLNYREHAVQKFREALGEENLRPAIYEVRHPLLNPHFIP